MSNPTNGVWQFDGTLDGTTQSGPVSFVGVDPILYDDGLWLREGNTNLYKYPSFETMLQPSMDNAADSLTRETGDPDATGTYVVQLVEATAGHGVQFIIEGLADNQDCVLSLDWWSESGATDYVWEAWNTEFSTLLQVSTPITAPATKERLVLSFVFHDGGSGRAIVYLTRATSASGTVRFDAVMATDRETDYFDGDSGDGYDWTATPHESPSTRAASSASVPTAGIISPLAGAIAFRTTPTIETGLEEIWGECGVKGAGTDHLRWGRDASRHPFVEWSSNDAAYQRLTSTHTVDAEDEHFYYLGHDGTDITLQVDGNTLETDTRDAVEDDFSTGDLELQASAGGVIFHELAMFSEMLGPEQVAKLESTQNWSMNTLGGSTIIMPLTAGRRPRI